MELRDVEIFLTLAQELHFGRTAERLRISPARVSQAIKAQERQIGGLLFDRTSRSVTLTDLGRQLHDDLLPAHRKLLEGIRRAREAARAGAPTLKLGMISWNVNDIQPYLDLLTARTEIRPARFGDPFELLRTGDTDAHIVWLPVHEPDITVGPVIWTEPVVLAMSAAHPLAGRDAVRYEDLADHIVMGGATPDYWRDALVPRRTPSGRLIPVGPQVTNGEDMYVAMAASQATSPVPAHALRYAQWPGLAFVPIADAPPLRWALIWRTDAQTDAVRDLAEIIRSRGPLQL
ncbi:MAG: LysR family transcriptional regulator [Hamadaea sp.]|nr:LysR family transcriptional regulator [Hamadaea sp.]